MTEGLACPTADDAGWVRGQIDHLLVGTGVEVLDVAALPRVADGGLRLSAMTGSWFGWDLAMTGALPDPDPSLHPLPPVP